MTDVVPVPASTHKPPPEPIELAFFPEDEAPSLSFAQEVNARRALIENPEMLRRLRSL